MLVGGKAASLGLPPPSILGRWRHLSRLCGCQPGRGLKDWGSLVGRDPGQPEASSPLPSPCPRPGLAICHPPPQVHAATEPPDGHPPAQLPGGSRPRPYLACPKVDGRPGAVAGSHWVPRLALQTTPGEPEGKLGPGGGPPPPSLNCTLPLEEAAGREGVCVRHDNGRVRRKWGGEFPFYTANRILSLDATPGLRGPEDSSASGLSSLHTHLAAS